MIVSKRPHQIPPGTYQRQDDRDQPTDPCSNKKLDIVVKSAGPRSIILCPSNNDEPASCIGTITNNWTLKDFIPCKLPNGQAPVVSGDSFSALSARPEY